MIERTEQGTVRMSRNGKVMVALLAAAVLIGLFAAWLSRGEFKGRYAVPSLGDRTGQAVPAPAPTAPAAKPALPAPVVRRAPVAPAAAPVDEYDDAAAAAEDDRDRMAAAIDRAARKALDRGEPVRWHKAGERGYVVVSEPRDYPDRTCRNVSATINTDDGPTQSSSHLWCTTPDGDWAPAE
jgi:hypothetical protein